MIHGFGGNSWQFINSTHAILPKDNDIRRTIRKQAMVKAAAARRDRGDYGKSNRRQRPPALTTTEEPQAIARAPLSTPDTNANAQDGVIELTGKVTRVATRSVSLDHSVALCIPQKLSPTGYERMKIQCDFDPLDLSALTSFHANRATAIALAEQPSRMLDVLECKQWSYFAFLPSKFGSNACLDDAVRCVAVRVRDWMLSPTAAPGSIVLSLYSKALKSLQTAIDNGSVRFEANVLCAIELLSIYELLDKTGTGAWSHHIAGASSLIELRGPKQYCSDFEKALFMAQLGPIFTEALLNSHACFLEQRAWQDVLRSVILDESPFSPRSEIVVSLWMCICRIPKLFNQVEDAVFGFDNLDQLPLTTLWNRVRRIRCDLSNWRQRYELLLANSDSFLLAQAKSDKRFETLGVCMAVLLVSSRLLVALGADDAPDLEDDAQSLAHRMLALGYECRGTNPRAGIFMSLKVIVANATLATRKEWREIADTDREAANGEGLLLLRQAWQRWCELKGRRKRAHL